MSAAVEEPTESFGESLSTMFNFVAKGALLYLGFGMLDLAIFHYDPGGVALFETIKEPILTLLDVTGVSDGLNWLAGALGGGTADMAINMGGAELALGGDLGSAFVPSY